MESIVNGGSLEQQLNFYRYKLSQHEQERIEWQENCEQVRHNIDRVHNQENETDQVKTEIAEL